MGHVPAHVMYICIFNDLMHHSLVINNARGLMPFIKRRSSNIKQDLVNPAVESNWKRLRGKREISVVRAWRRGKTPASEFINQTEWIGHERAN